MDPDNRNAVDYKSLKKESLKQWVTARGLKCRRQYKELFLTGEYLPLKVYNERGENVVAFLRRKDDDVAIVVVGRFFTQLTSPPLGQECWGETEIELPKDLKNNELRDIFTDKAVPIRKKEGRLTLSVADLFQEFPFTLLISGK